MIAQRCADCGRPLVAVAEPVIEGQPRPRALLGVSVVVDYGPPTRDRAGGELALCIPCGGVREVAGAAQPAPPAAAAPAKAPARKRAPAQVETPSRPAMVVEAPAAAPSAADLAAARGAIRPPPARR